jgi:hypothetical protein
VDDVDDGDVDDDDDTAAVTLGGRCLSSIQSLNTRYLVANVTKISPWMASNVVALNPSTDFFFSVHLQTFFKVFDSLYLYCSKSRCHIFMFDHISAIRKSGFAHIRNLGRILNYLDQNIAITVAALLVHSRLIDYFNSMFLNLPASLLNRLQLIINVIARVIRLRTPKWSHISPI